LYIPDPPLFVLLTNAYLSCLDLGTGCMSPKIRLQSYKFRTCASPSYLVLDSTQLFCCGGTGKYHPDHTLPSNQVLTVNISTGKIGQKPNMTIARAACGLALYQKAVYVFGGSGKISSSLPSALTSTESFNLPLNHWNMIGYMNKPRENFNPCVWRKEIYLCDGYSTDIFTVETRSFRAISLPLPLRGSALVCVNGAELVVVTVDSMVVLRYRNEALEVEKKQCSALHSASQCPPLLWESRIYSFFRKNVAVLDAKTGEKCS